MGNFFRRPAPQQAVPDDLGDLRQQLIGLLGQGQQQASPRAGPYGQMLGSRKTTNLTGGAAAGGGGSGSLLDVIRQFGLGQQPQPGVSDLQRQSSMGIGQFLNQGAPEQRALDIALPALMQQLNATNPGGDVLDPLSAIFGRNLTDQIQQLNASSPGRWSSANIEQQGRLRERSTGDFNLLAQQIMEQGRQRQLQAASTLGVLSGQAGQNPFQRLLGAGQLGTQQTQLAQQQSQFSQQQQLQAIMAILGPILGPTFGGPFTQGASGFENLLAAGQTASGFIPFAGGGGGGQTQLPGFATPNYGAVPPTTPVQRPW